jgi:O-antigen/teichoic acid export membrane protein
LIRLYLNKVIGKLSGGDNNLVQLLSHSKNYISANFFLKGLTFLTIPVFTRLLSPADYGNISLYTTLISIFGIIFILGADGALYRYYFEKNEDYHSFLGTNMVFLLFVNILFVSILYLFKNYITNLFSLNENIYNYAIIVSFLSVPVALLLADYQCSLKSKKYSIINILKYSSITLLSIVLIMLMSENLYMGRVYSELLVGLVFFVYALVLLLKFSKFNLKFKYIKYSLLLGIPLLPGALSQFALNFFDRLIINQVNGENEVGLYSFAFNIGMVMNTFVMGMNQSWAPIFYDKLKNEKNAEIHSLSPKYVNIIFSTAILLILFSKEIVYILGEKRYHVALNIIPIVMLGYVFIFLYTLYANYAFYYKKVWLITLFTVISGVVSVVLNYILIPKYGYKFASISALASYVLLFVLHYGNVRYILKIKHLIPIRKTSVKVLFIILTTILFYCCEYFEIGYLPGLILKFVFGIIIIYLLYRL